MGDHLEIIIFPSILLILLNTLNSLISLSELHKIPNKGCSCIVKIEQFHPAVYKRQSSSI